MNSLLAPRRSLLCPGKINLFLDVTARRADGYHEIETLFLPLAGLQDKLSFTASSAPGLTITCDHPEVPCDERNLVWKAAELFAQSAQVAVQGRFDLVKRLPVCGGMGGGSSNAAAALLLLNQQHGLPLRSEQLAALALRLGADVPFFLNPRPALARGVGEVLQPVRLRMELHFILAFSSFPIPAAWAYQHRQGPMPSRPGGLARLLAALDAKDLASAANEVFNALAPAAFAKFAPLALLHEELHSYAGVLAVELSGSGPTVFALCADAASAQAAAAQLVRNFGWPAHALTIASCPPCPPDCP